MIRSCSWKLILQNFPRILTGDQTLASKKVYKKQLISLDHAGMTDLVQVTKNIRKALLQMNHRANASHSGSALSIVELLTVLYFRYLNVDPKNPKDPKRDKFILSKGHASSALY